MKKERASKRGVKSVEERLLEEEVIAQASRRAGEASLAKAKKVTGRYRPRFNKLEIRTLDLDLGRYEKALDDQRSIEVIDPTGARWSLEWRTNNGPPVLILRLIEAGDNDHVGCLEIRPEAANTIAIKPQPWPRT